MHAEDGQSGVHLITLEWVVGTNSLQGVTTSCFSGHEGKKNSFCIQIYRYGLINVCVGHGGGINACA